jgi:hypothetical protein
MGGSGSPIEQSHHAGPDVIEIRRRHLELGERSCRRRIPRRPVEARSSRASPTVLDAGGHAKLPRRLSDVIHLSGADSLRKRRFIKGATRSASTGFENR